MTHAIIKGKYADSFSTNGAIYVLLPTPSDAQFGHSPRTLAEPMRARWEAAHPGKIPELDVLVEVLRVAYRHYPCPHRRQKHPGLNAIQWAMYELNQYLTYCVSHIPNTTIHRIKGTDPRLLPDPVVGDAETEKDPCQSTTSGATPAEPSNVTPSSSTTTSKHVQTAEESDAPPTTGETAHTHSATPSLPLSLAERLIAPPKSGRRSGRNTSRRTAPS